MNTNTENAVVAPAAATDPLADVATSHAVTEAERQALAAEPAQPASPPAAQPAPAAPISEGTAPAAAGPAAPEPPVAAPPPAAAVVAATAAGPTLLTVPASPKDFDAEFARLDARMESGEIDAAQRDKAFRELAIEHATYEGRRASIETHNAATVQAWQQEATASFDQAAAAWTADNKEFMANPLRAAAFQQAINIVDAQTGGVLPANELLAQAAKMAFEANGWDPAAHSAAPQRPTPSASAAALAARQPPTATVPQTLGDAPNSGADNGTSRFANLENLGIQELESAVARMSLAEQDAWLREVDSAIR